MTGLTDFLRVIGASAYLRLLLLRCLEKPLLITITASPRKRLGFQPVYTPLKCSIRSNVMVSLHSSI